MRSVWLLLCLGLLALTLSQVRAEDPIANLDLEDIAEFDEDDEEYLTLLEEKSKVCTASIHLKLGEFLYLTFYLVLEQGCGA